MKSILDCRGHQTIMKISLMRRYCCVLLSLATVICFLYASKQLYKFRYRVGYSPSATEIKGQSVLRKVPHEDHENPPKQDVRNATEPIDVQNVTREPNCTQADMDRRPGKLVLTTTNAAFIDFTDNWLESIRRTRTCPSIQIVAEDDVTMTYYANKTAQYPGLRVVKTWFGEKNPDQLKFASAAFNKFVNKRQKYIIQLVQHGYEVLFTDVDTYWLRDPFPYFKDDFDIAVERDLPMFYCAGFVYFKPTKNTIAFLSAWIDYMATDDKASPDQKVMNDLIKLNKIPGLKVKILDSDNFPNGKKFFDRKWRENKRDIAVVHNNWIIGHEAKVKRFQKCGMWLYDGKSNSPKLCV